MIKAATMATGIGSAELALEELSKEEKFDLEISFGCEIDKYARNTITKHVIKAIIKKLLPLLID
jgi:site-specific DNA-cytosine methylase